MSHVSTLFERVVGELGYAEANGIVRRGETPSSGPRAMVLHRIERHLPQIQAVYFAEDDPLVYFSERDEFQRPQLAEIHRKVWNDSRVPVVFAIDRSHVRIYNAWAKPVRGDEDPDDSTDRLLRKLETASVRLENLREFHRSRMDTGAYVTDLGGRFDASTRCDQTLLANLEETYQQLTSTKPKLPPDIAHRLLIRSILLLHLEHRGRLGPWVYGKYVPGAKTLTDVYDADRDAAFRLFDRTARKFNGDLLPVDATEQSVQTHHLNRLAELLRGDVDLKSGQLTLWPLYDFSVIPIQLVSSLWERLLHLGDPEKARKTGAYYTPFPLVEMMLNEVLPWPRPDDTPLQALPSVIDPACGSGVFLVEAFRRLAAHWRHRHRRRRLRCEDLEAIVTEHIHGIDSEETGLAVKVAAFSLYLAMLDELDADAPLRFPKLTASRGAAPPNVIQGCAFRQQEQAPREFDLVVGNPPWRRGRLPERIQSYCDRTGHPVAGEISQAFLWLAGDLSPHGQVAMLGPSKWLFNREGPDVEFRRAFFASNHVDAVINLSALVGGANRLFNANAPATVVVFRRARTRVPSPAILYCAPRPAPRPGLPTALVIDAADIKWLPRDEAETQDDIWKVMYVGGWRDLALVRRLRRHRGTLGKFERSRRSRGWKSGRGFQPNGEKTSETDATARYILEIPYVTGDALSKYIADPFDPSITWTEDSFKRTGPREIYQGPHVLFKRAIEDCRVFATYASEACSFPDKVMGIGAPEQHSRVLKALTAFINSSLASYYLFATTSSWGVDRRWLNKGEILTLPSWLLESTDTVVELARLLDDYASARSTGARNRVVDEIDSVVFDAFEVSAGERVLVRDMLGTSVDFVHRRRDSRGLKPPSTRDLERYAIAFAGVFGQVVSASGEKVTWTVYDGTTPLRVVSFVISSSKRGGRISSSRTLSDVLCQLDSQLREREGINLYRRRHVRVFEDRAVHIVKPAELRFWTESAAFHDADEVIAQTLAGDNGGAA